MRIDMHTSAEELVATFDHTQNFFAGNDPAKAARLVRTIDRLLARMPVHGRFGGRQWNQFELLGLAADAKRFLAAHSAASAA